MGETIVLEAQKLKTISSESLGSFWEDSCNNYSASKGMNKPHKVEVVQLNQKALLE